MKWNYDKFVLPEQVKKDWEEIGKRNIELSKEWEKQNSLTLKNIKKINDELLDNIERGKKESINYFLKNKENIATRKSSEIVLDDGRIESIFEVGVNFLQIEEDAQELLEELTLSIQETTLPFAKSSAK